MSYHAHIQLELQRVELQLDLMTRRWEAEADIARAGERLYRILQATGHAGLDETVRDAIANLGDAIRAGLELEGGGR